MAHMVHLENKEFKDFQGVESEPPYIFQMAETDFWHGMKSNLVQRNQQPF